MQTDDLRLMYFLEITLLVRYGGNDYLGRHI